MEHFANADITDYEDRRMMQAPTRDASRADERRDLAANPPSPSDLARIEKVAIFVAAVMTLSPLAAAAWGALVTG